MSMQVTGVDVARYFGSTGKAKRRLDWWKSLPGREYVADKVLAHKSARIYDVEPQHILSLDTEHPLGDLREDFHNTAKLVRDWRPNFAFSHLFHFCLEDLGRIYSWQEFRDGWSAAPARRPWLWEPAQMMQAKAADHLVKTKNISRDEALVSARNAMQWRIGAFYYSFLREIYALGWLRQHGLPCLSHPLADALFRADLWCGNAVVSIYIGNPNYRSGSQGRKHPAEDHLGDQSRFSFVDLQMARPNKFGTVALPTDTEMKRCANEIRACRDSWDISWAQPSSSALLWSDKGALISRQRSS
ncbi:hypothetical protein LTT66_22735 [Nocardia gipuzkoensis]|uniref:hypothetical protein n=1 Tax=Nocardia gipuzkoensis TaxID=2749991 RepID=UPI001E610724|nr:hypothetical protein [Nocardia gipuzkoensis]UGT66114.1 hypothetical protein LTT66_22735 [Nocardia gipuzkoensis]